jgi:hypothetical protein
MDSRNERAAQYRKSASRCAELAKSVELGFLKDVYQRTAVRYALMADDLERRNMILTSLVDRSDALVGILGAAGHPAVK